MDHLLRGLFYTLIGVSNICAAIVDRNYTIVSHIHVYAPHFATLALVESVGGFYAGSDIYLANMPPLPGPRLDVDIGTCITD